MLAAVGFLFGYVGAAVGGEATTLAILARGHGTISDEKQLAGLLILLVSGVCLGPFWVLVKQQERRRAEENKRRVMKWMYLGYSTLFLLAIWGLPRKIH